MSRGDATSLILVRLNEFLHDLRRLDVKWDSVIRYKERHQEKQNKTNKKSEKSLPISKRCCQWQNKREKNETTTTKKKHKQTKENSTVSWESTSARYDVERRIVKLITTYHFDNSGWSLRLCLLPGQLKLPTICCNYLLSLSHGHEHTLNKLYYEQALELQAFSWCIWHSGRS